MTGVLPARDAERLSISTSKLAMATTGGQTAVSEPAQGHDTLKYQLLGPSLTKAGQDDVDQRKVSRARPPRRPATTR